MSKNKGVVIASVGILVALIAAVLLIRSPVEKKEDQPPPQPIAETTNPAPDYEPKEMDDSHRQVAAIIDKGIEAVAKEAPGLWGKVVDRWNWLMGFDAKYAIILIAITVFIFGIIVTNSNKNKRA